MSYYDRQHSSTSSARRGPSKPAAATWSAQPLTPAQKAKLSIAARSAWDIQTKAGLTDGSFDDWRHAQTKIACGHASFRAATNSHFRSILGHFFRLAGKTGRAAALWARTGRVAGSDQVGDTHENREAARVIIRTIIDASNGLLSEAYVAAIMRGRFDNLALSDLTARDLQQLAYILRARLRKMIPR